MYSKSNLSTDNFIVISIDKVDSDLNYETSKLRCNFSSLKLISAVNLNNNASTGTGTCVGVSSTPPYESLIEGKNVKDLIKELVVDIFDEITK